MTEDSKPAPGKASEKQQPGKQPESAKKTTDTLSSILRTVKIILALGFIAALLAGSWLGWVHWQKWAAGADKSQIQLTNLRDSIDSIQRQYSLDQKQQAQQSQEFQQLITDLQLRSNAQGRRLAELGSTSRSDWLLAEAVYLTRLASSAAANRAPHQKLPGAAQQCGSDTCRSWMTRTSPLRAVLWPRILLRCG